MASLRDRKSLSQRVFWTIFLVALLVISFFTVAGTVYLRTRLAEGARAELGDETKVVAAALDDADDDTALLDRLELKDTRITIVNPDGAVAFDSMRHASMLGNHGDREEIREALETGHGSSERTSNTLGEGMLYEAELLENGSVVRLAQKQAGFLSIFSTLMWPVVTLAFAAAVVAWVTARREARAIIAPLTLVDLDHPRRSKDNAYAEMEPMLDRIEKQRQELKRQMRVLADNDRMRREFTANITHELKTPLTTVSGYAELIANGMVESDEDLRDFGGRIYREAGRLTALVNDILTLSNLDEAEHAGENAKLTTDVMGQREDVNLSRLVGTVCQRLESVAAKSQVELSFDAHDAIVKGVPRLLDELVYNLTSNAIRYNKQGGTVKVSCGLTDGGAPFVRVEDTGIGIAPEDRDKIFERFYRVDKSRSKARGGTGLGLAIVKHAALYHNATIDLQSKLGQGTTITVTFPVSEAPAPASGKPGQEPR